MKAPPLLRWGRHLRVRAANNLLTVQTICRHIVHMTDTATATHTDRFSELAAIAGLATEQPEGDAYYVQSGSTFHDGFDIIGWTLDPSEALAAAKALQPYAVASETITAKAWG